MSEDLDYAEWQRRKGSEGSPLMPRFAPTPAAAAAARTRGTAGSQPTAAERGVPQRAWDGGGVRFDPPPVPIRVPSLLDKVKKVLKPTPPSENRAKRMQESGEVPDAERKKSDPGKPDPPGTKSIKTPQIPF